MAAKTLQSQNLDDFQWKYRILILADTDVKQKELKTAYNLLKTKKKEWKERNLIVLFLNDERLFNTKQETVGHNLNLPKNYRGYLLIGKDGGIKMREAYPLEPKKIFDRIDAMPMRRAEMRTNNN